MNAYQRRASSQSRRKVQSVLYLLGKRFGPNSAECIYLRDRLGDIDTFIAARLTIPDAQLAQIVWEFVAADRSATAPNADDDGIRPGLTDVDVAGPIGKVAIEAKPIAELNEIADGLEAAEVDDWSKVIDVQNLFANLQLEMAKSAERTKRNRMRMELRNQMESNADRAKNERSRKLEELKLLEGQIERDKRLELEQKQAELHHKHRVRDELLLMRQTQCIERQNQRLMQMKEEREFIQELERTEQEQEMARQRKREQQRLNNAEFNEQNQQMKAEKLIAKQNERDEDSKRIRVYLENELILKQLDEEKQKQRQKKLALGEQLALMNHQKDNDRLREEMSKIEHYQRRKRLEEERKLCEDRDRRRALLRQCQAENKHILEEKRQLQLHDDMEKLRQRLQDEQDQMQYEMMIGRQLTEQRQKRNQSRLDLERQIAEKNSSLETMNAVERALNKRYLEAYEQKQFDMHMPFPIPIDRVCMDRPIRGGSDIRNSTTSEGNHGTITVLKSKDTDARPILSHPRAAEVTDEQHASPPLRAVEPEPFPNLDSVVKSGSPFALDDEFNIPVEFTKRYSKQYRPARSGALRQSASALLYEARRNAESLFGYRRH